MSRYRPWNMQNPPAPPVAPSPAMSVDPALALVSPAVAIQRMSGLGSHPGQRIGQTDSEIAIGAGVGVLLIAVTAAFSYYAGAAMAPRPTDKNTWGLVGIPVGLFTGAWGLGIMGIVSMRR